ncbi:hypothetical protein [Pelagibius sp.]|uniref:hypothetical protein n=1 Tax=Pelagibius sp. TaxID=1931238 RepID=UPI003BB210EC
MPRSSAAAQPPLFDPSNPAEVDTALEAAGPGQARHILTIKLSYVLGFLWVAVAGVVMLSLLQDLLIFGLPDAGLSERIYRLDLDTEASLPTWLASALMACASALLFLVAVQVKREQPRKAIPWFFLAVVFCALSVDEIAMIHEWLSGFLSARIDNSGLFYFAWTIPALVICLAGLICFIPFILSFKGIDRILLAGSAVVFLSGAIGMEMLGGSVAEVGGVETLQYRIFTTIEETLEYSGVLLFLYFILRQLRRSFNRTTICFE